MSGNHKRQTFADCEYCGNRFGPLQNLKIRFCSRLCSYTSRKGKPGLTLGRHYESMQRAKIKICLVCNKTFRAIKEFRGRLTKYCSKQCWRNRCGGNKTPLIKRLRNSEEYKEWRQAVFTRDNYTCQNCGDNRGGNLEAHHINPVSTFILLIYDVNNGITLCSKCHAETYTHKPRVDVCVKRWKAFTNKKAIKVLEEKAA